MNNLQWLYDTNDMFRDAVKQAAAYYIGSTSLNFAGTWLEEQHRSDYEDLTGQHVNADVDSREKLEADVRKYAWANQALMLESFDFPSLVIGWLDRQAVITEREAKSRNIEWQRELIDTLNELDDSAERIEELEAFVERLEEAAEQFNDVTLAGVDYTPVEMRERAMMDDELRNIAEKYREDAIAAQKERDAYRELCGKMRLLANEIALMEVD